MLKIGIISATILTLTLFSFSEPLVFGESDRKYFRATEDTFVNCVVACDSGDEHGDKDFLHSTYHNGELISSEFSVEDGDLLVTNSYLQTENRTAVFLKFPIRDMPSSTLFEDVKISKAELRFLALPFTTYDGDKGGYSGKVISSLFLCNERDESKSSPQCVYGDEPFDSIIINTDDLPQFLVFDITRIFDKSKNIKNKELLFAIESKPIEVLKQRDYEQYSDFVMENFPEILRYISKDNSDVLGLENLFFQLNSTSTEELVSQLSLAGEMSQRFRIMEFFIFESESEDAEFLKRFPDISNQPLNKLITGFSFGPPVEFYFRVVTDPADFFMIPSSEHESLNQPTLIVDYEILDSEFSNGFTYFLGLVLPALAIIVPVLFWIIKKKNKKIPTNQPSS